MSEFEKAVRHRLIDLNWSITDLAKELDCSVSYVYEIIKGTRKAVEMKQKICVLLGLEAGDYEQNDG